MILHPQWRECARLWPEAPAVLSVRDPEDWYESVLGSIHAWTAPGRDVGPAAVAELLARFSDVDFGGWIGRSTPDTRSPVSKGTTGRSALPRGTRDARVRASSDIRFFIRELRDIAAARFPYCG